MTDFARELRARLEMRGLRIDDVRDKRIAVLKTDFKRGDSARRYAEMVAFVQGNGTATFGDVLANTAYHMGDVRWDLARNHIGFADEIDGPQVRLQRALPMEGELSQRLVQTRMRSASVRELCIEFHGSRCFACELDFRESFGTMFAGLIEVHHKNPIAQRNGGVQTDPGTDCIPSIEELQTLFVRRGNA